ncbi:adhesion G protein-coupled receptor A3 isoform X2 [Cylas formicarius]|uniref:adhesion G protein-coupled receptor A3 isoform X2 n=1 Tax=Cylas formicarius TaxID=197179 RepID=UPI0029585CB7|nr:adhesion G protein-coupled receptor A3 isoform X2 [Cylas formicarius]
MKFVVVCLCVVLFIVEVNSADYGLCPANCTCKVNSQRDGANYLKMVCGETNKITSLEQLELLNLANELSQLNLSNNRLKTFQPKVELVALQKLNLSGNDINVLSKHQFREVPNLRRLDLSMNSLRHVDVLAFEGLHHLERLKLNNNLITTLKLGTFNSLSNLKQLDLSNNPLQCDCGLLWVLTFVQRSELKLVSNPKCASPLSFKGHFLRKLKVGVDIHCKSPATHDGLPLIDMTPGNNQIVFAGDSLKLHCRAPIISDLVDDSNLEWLWLDAKPKKYFNDVSVETEFLHSMGFIDSTLIVKKLRKAHEGVWTCLYTSREGNHSKSITIVVISDDTVFCPTTTTQNNKGTYVWPKTISNNTAELPCESLNLYYNESEQRASYSCSPNGTWQLLNTSRCSYVSDNTKILQQFSRVNSSIPESTRHFKNFTSNVTIFKDVMDLVYAVDTIENYSSLDASENTNSILMDVASNLLNLPWAYWRKADKEHGLCQRLVNVTERIATSNSATLFQQENFVIESFQITKAVFSGLHCSWFINPANHVDSLFSCSTNDLRDSTVLHGKMMEASIAVPEKLLPVEEAEKKTEENYFLIISAHSNAKLFPIEDERVDEEGISSAVVGLKIAGLNAARVHVDRPVVVTLKKPPSSSFEVNPFTPAVWHSELKRWTTEPCEFDKQTDAHVSFICHQIGYYGLLQDAAYITNMSTSPGYFRLCHPAIYIGNVVLFVSLLVAVMTYLFCFAAIQMPRNAKHCLINTWLSVALLCYIYTLGIYQTEDQKLCQIVGLVLHYLSLSSVLWICVSVNSMYKRFSKNGGVMLQDDDMPMEQTVARKPTLGLYLVGWGVALIVCGLSAAINIRHYSSPSHCFLRTGPALSALYVPFLILLLFLFFTFLLIKCAIYKWNFSHGGHLSEGTQATEHVDLDLLEPSFTQGDARSTRSYSSKTATNDTEDNERSPSAQLKAHVIFFFLYVTTWLSCAFATVPPLRTVPYEAEFFSVAYAIFGITLSAFTLFFYCFARSDVRNQWLLMFRWMRHKRVFRFHTVSDTSPTLQAQPLPLPPRPNSEVHFTSRSSSRSSHRAKSISFKGHDLNDSISNRNSLPTSSKINNLNLQAQYRSGVVPHIIENPTVSADIFYNPYQIIAARRFFRKQRRERMKRNNLVARPPRDVNSDSNSVMSEPRPVRIKHNDRHDFFGTNSKVNNTNIHVEQVRRTLRQRNPNIFSDSDDCDSKGLPLEKLALDNSERCRKRDPYRRKCRKKLDGAIETPMQTIMRTVSQQCTLEYSSDSAVSDSVLDKNGAGSPVSPKEAVRRDPNPKGADATPETTLHVCVRRENSHLGEDDDEEEHQYVEIDEFRSETTRLSGAELKRKKGTFMQRLRSPSEFSRTSSVSATDIDEIYQQIRRDPVQPKGYRRDYATVPAQRAHSSPFLHDSALRGGAASKRNRVVCGGGSFDVESKV